ncbi:MAG: hypothetical protein V3U54_12970 [Thermodesulfobacteriota bacterium]
MRGERVFQLEKHGPWHPVYEDYFIRTIRREYAIWSILGITRTELGEYSDYEYDILFIYSQVVAEKQIDDMKKKGK